MKPNWPTPRLLLEVRENGVWVPVKIYVQYKSVHTLLSQLPAISQTFGGIENVRVKNLREDAEIAAAKLEIYKREDKKRRRRKH